MNTDKKLKEIQEREFLYRADMGDCPMCQDIRSLLSHIEALNEELTNRRLHIETLQQDDEEQNKQFDEQIRRHIEEKAELKKFIMKLEIDVASLERVREVGDKLFYAVSAYWDSASHENRLRVDAALGEYDKELARHEREHPKEDKP